MYVAVTHWIALADRLSLLIRTVTVEWCYGVTAPLSAQDLASVLIPFFESSPVAPTNDVKFDILFAEDNFVYQKVVI